MSLTNPNTPVSQQDLQDFYHKLLPYMGGSFEMIANKFSKGDLYSTNEKMIGQWIDGKPLYQIVLDFGNLPSSGSSYADISVVSLNVDTWVNAWGMADLHESNSNFAGAIFLPTKSVISSMPYETSIKSSMNKEKLVIYYSLGNFTIRNCKIVFQYTKTTDSPISIGEATDYSTTEKVIGTWINGKPIYQKTVVTNTPSTSGADTVVVETSAWNIDTPISVKAFTLGNWNNIKYNQEIPYTESANPASYVYLSSGSSEQTFIQFNNSDDLYCKCGSARTNVPLYITLQYTKTTD